jgi:hypothetical protein
MLSSCRIGTDLGFWTDAGGPDTACRKACESAAMGDGGGGDDGPAMAFLPLAVSLVRGSPCKARMAMVPRLVFGL